MKTYMRLIMCAVLMLSFVGVMPGVVSVARGEDLAVEEMQAVLAVNEVNVLTDDPAFSAFTFSDGGRIAVRRSLLSEEDIDILYNGPGALEWEKIPYPRDGGPRKIHVMPDLTEIWAEVIVKVYTYASDPAVKRLWYVGVHAKEGPFAFVEMPQGPPKEIALMGDDISRFAQMTAAARIQFGRPMAKSIRGITLRVKEEVPLIVQEWSAAGSPRLAGEIQSLVKVIPATIGAYRDGKVIAIAEGKGSLVAEHVHALLGLTIRHRAPFEGLPDPALKAQELAELRRARHMRETRDKDKILEVIKVDPIAGKATIRLLDDKEAILKEVTLGIDEEQRYFDPNPEEVAYIFRLKGIKAADAVTDTPNTALFEMNDTFKPEARRQLIEDAAVGDIYKDAAKNRELEITEIDGVGKTAAFRLREAGVELAAGRLVIAMSHVCLTPNGDMFIASLTDVMQMVDFTTGRAVNEARIMIPEDYQLVKIPTKVSFTAPRSIREGTFAQANVIVWDQKEKDMGVPYGQILFKSEKPLVLAIDDKGGIRGVAQSKGLPVRLTADYLGLHRELTMNVIK